MERSSRRLDLPRLRRLQLIVLLLQLGCLGLLILVMVREPLPLCRLQQAMGELVEATAITKAQVGR
jgi:hypothetical protein